MLTRSLDQIDPSEPNIVQRYMHRPHLLDGYKYDLRLYVLVSAISPLRIYLFEEGLVRLVGMAAWRASSASDSGSDSDSDPSPPPPPPLPGAHVYREVRAADRV